VKAYMCAEEGWGEFSSVLVLMRHTDSYNTFIRKNFFYK